MQRLAVGPPTPPPSTHTHNKHTSHTHMHINTHHSISEDQQQRPLTRAFIKSQIVMAVGRGHRKVGLPGQITAMHTGQQSRPLTVVAHQPTQSFSWWPAVEAMPEVSHHRAHSYGQQQRPLLIPLTQVTHIHAGQQQGPQLRPLTVSVNLLS